ncbi:eukaryotic translation initiation factor 4 gamma 3-like isoform X1 [Diabrotica undecimpunctata]|uniref:eukaryotic translation initiation factor 4 gamma 3-like isoform X1 n=3 Tax=Diabrotica undecimpunctata TaxID=50387 RepID=UPI003B6352DE
MSSNQKQTAAGGPQTQRYTSSPYQPIPQPVPGNEYDYNYRPEGGYPVSTPPGPYVQPPTNQGGNQGPTLRGPSGPPNQSSTPPNAADIKVSTLPQQPSLNHMFISPAVRPTANFYTRATGPPSQQPRMTSHNSRPPQPPLFSPTQAQFMHMAPAAPQVYLTSTNSVGYTYGAQRPAPTGFVPQSVPVFSYGYGTTATQAPHISYNYYQPQMMPPRGGSIPQQTAANPNTTQNTMPNVPLVSNNHQQQPFQRQTQMKRRPKAVAIIDPNTGADRLLEMFEDNNSHPPSGESSARQTPQPSAGAVSSHTKEVQATFAKQVLQAINDPTPEHQTHHHHHPPPHQQEDHHVELQLEGQPTNHILMEYDCAVPPRHDGQQIQQPHQLKMEHVVQSSKLQAGAKEFVLPSAVTKETPIVSANIDAVEVTLLPNKLPKDRESPVKGRKQREQSSRGSETIKEAPVVMEKPPPVMIAPIKEVVSDKESSNTKDEVQDISSSSIIQSTNPTQVLPVSKDSVIIAKDVSANIEKQHQQHRPPPIQQQHQQHRKDIKEPQPKIGLERQDSGSSVGSAQNAPITVAAVPDNPKSKPNAQRSTSKQGSGGPNNQKPASQPSVPIPQPQPAKAASRSNKKNELNMKGANKEGTDMDAFNDNALREEVNSNVIPNQTVNNNNDIINANSIPPTTNSNATPTQPPVVRDVNVNIQTNKKFDNETTIKPQEPVTKPFKNKVDITDIVKEKPKNIKPFNNTIEGQDETDRSALVQSNEKMVQAKNDVNVKTSEISKVESKLPYAEGQWSPANQNGLKIYDKNFLLSLKDCPASKVAPDNILDALLPDEKGRLSDGRLSMGGKTDFNPPFNTFGRNSSQKGSLSSRLSGSKMDRSKSNKGSTVKPPIKVSISVREEVRLHEVENAWRPTRLVKGEFQTEDDKKTEELYKKVRGILNKLTPQKFETLLQQIRSLSIDTTGRLQGVIDLVFEKAIDEPNFSVAYASMCQQLALLQTPSNHGEDKQDFVTFRKLLINKCQQEFEKQKSDETLRNSKIKEIEACTDPEKKKDLEFELEEYDRRLRMKSVGNVRFIGELFKQSMLTVGIMTRCINDLLIRRDEERLECLCKLLTTIGKELETKHVPLEPIFEQMKSIANKKDPNSKISSRIRFMLQDVIDLRSAKWVPRRQDVNPKMIDQIQKEAEQEQLNIQMMNSGPITPRKDDRGSGSGGPGGGSMSDRKGGRSRNVTDDGWTTNTSNNRSKASFMVQSDKLKGARAPLEPSLGAPNMFKQWNTGAGSNIKPIPQVPTTANIYSTLENLESEKRNTINTRYSQKDSYHSKGASMERGSYKYDSRSGSRSGSQHRSKDEGRNSSSSQRNIPAAAPTMLPPQSSVAPAPSVSAVAAVPEVQLSEDQRYRRILNCADEYVSGNSNVDEYFADISSCVPLSYIPSMINDTYLHVLEKSQQVRLKTGALFAKLVGMGKISVEDYCQGLEELLSQADDLRIDIPKLWDYLAEILVDLITEQVVPLKRLHKSFSILIELNQADKLLAPLFKLIISNKGSHFLHSQWQLSGLQLVDFMDTAQIESFINDNQFEFLLGGAAPAVDQSRLSYDDIQEKLLNFLRADKTIDDIHDWVMTNVGEKGVKENKFIRALAMACFEDSINKNNKPIIDRLDQHFPLLHKYVDNKPGFELECLYALQALNNKMEYPGGLLLQICDRIYEVGCCSQESFVAWEQSDDPLEQEGKGVAMKQLTSFFCSLKENDDDDDSGSDLEAD